MNPSVPSRKPIHEKRSLMCPLDHPGIGLRGKMQKTTLTPTSALGGRDKVFKQAGGCGEYKLFQERHMVAYKQTPRACPGDLWIHVYAVRMDCGHRNYRSCAYGVEARFAFLIWPTFGHPGPEKASSPTPLGVRRMPDRSAAALTPVSLSLARQGGAIAVGCRSLVQGWVCFCRLSLPVKCNLG